MIAVPFMRQVAILAILAAAASSAAAQPTQSARPLPWRIGEPEVVWSFAPERGPSAFPIDGIRAFVFIADAGYAVATAERTGTGGDRVSVVQLDPGGAVRRISPILGLARPRDEDARPWILQMSILDDGGIAISTLPQIVRLDPNGTQVWTISHKALGMDSIGTTAALSGGGLAVFGSSNRAEGQCAGAPCRHVHGPSLAKIARDGRIEWSRWIGGTTPASISRWRSYAFPVESRVDFEISLLVRSTGEFPNRRANRACPSFEANRSILRVDPRNGNVVGDYQLPSLVRHSWQVDHRRSYGRRGIGIERIRLTETQGYAVLGRTRLAELREVQFMLWFGPDRARNGPEVACIVLPDLTASVAGRTVQQPAYLEDMVALGDTLLVLSRMPLESEPSPRRVDGVEVPRRVDFILRAVGPDRRVSVRARRELRVPALHDLELAPDASAFVGIARGEGAEPDRLIRVPIVRDR